MLLFDVFSMCMFVKQDPKKFRKYTEQLLKLMMLVTFTFFKV